MAAGEQECIGKSIVLSRYVPCKLLTTGSALQLSILQNATRLQKAPIWLDKLISLYRTRGKAGGPISARSRTTLVGNV